ncbi:50S ribosomal protein L24e [archaeon]|nr:50S ribosomal protein L24e [archaeon]|tara:strand:- start:4723 stop:4902 length:180 start_codon:yes stop_codon:yes gene_type:complete
MANCNFCGNVINFGEGLTLIKNDGRILRFDKKKCEKNLLKLARKPRRVKWSKSFVKGVK